MKRTLFFLLLTCALACGDDDTGATDTGGADTSTGDTAVTPDASADTNPADTNPAEDTSVAEDTNPPGDLRSTVMTAEFGAVTEPLSLAYFGRNLDGSFHVEVHGDPIDEECPTMGTPSPGRSLVLGSFASPVAAEQDLVAAVLFDFRGTLTDAPLLRFTSGTQNGLTWSLMGEADDEMSVAVDVTFPGGTVTGRFYATHCESMDERAP